MLQMRLEAKPMVFTWSKTFWRYVAIRSANAQTMMVVLPTLLTACKNAVQIVNRLT